MYVMRELVHCKAGKVRAMVEKFKMLSEALEEIGHQPLRLLTDVSGERFWTVVVEATVERVDDFFVFEKELMGKPAIRERMADYHDLVESGSREIYRVEG